MSVLSGGMSPFSLPNFAPAIKPPQQSQDVPAYWLLLQANKLVVLQDDSRTSIPMALDVAALGLQPDNTQYLGYLNGTDGKIQHCYTGELAEDESLPDGYAAGDLRSLFGRIDETGLALAGRAVQIVAWERTHRFCGRCGSPTESLPNERAKRCPECGLSNYPRLSPAIIIAIKRKVDDHEEILLARNHRFPEGRYSILAGFVEPGESLEECAHREVFEEVGIHIDDIRYFGSQPWPFPNSLMIGFTAEYAGGELVLEEGEIAEAQWFRAVSLPKLPPRVSIARRLIDSFVTRNGVAIGSVENW